MRIRSSGGYFTTFLGVARRYGEKIFNGERVPIAGRLLYALGEFLDLRPAQECARSLARAHRLYGG